MSYELFIDGQISGEIGTNSGFHKMARFCETRGKEMKAFFEDGESKNPVGLRDELQGLLNGNDTPEADVRETVKLLITRLGGVTEGKVTASNG